MTTTANTHAGTMDMHALFSRDAPGDGSDGNKLSMGTLVGVVFGALFLFAVLVMLGVGVWRRRQLTASPSSSPATPHPSCARSRTKSIDSDENRADVASHRDSSVTGISLVDAPSKPFTAKASLAQDAHWEEPRIPLPRAVVLPWMSRRKPEVLGKT
ncbi:uncharacterized protein BXZ73DRAFT_100699 [Epithele typhae]|uniref:uncharacterized protein n=1 Tax=Epithele typhae TaxID=378194 RepID=UPI002008B342|nr:uncharacterized protein BXZ73DRAFT_100699 [Epithele typhae]KAH9934509.1 hypothetical protein BXZ73DRAFT_100699 [Epithele typhae]